MLIPPNSIFENGLIDFGLLGLFDSVVATLA
jgi:hypothetical protein